MPLYRAELLAKKPLRYAALIHDVSQVLYLPFDYDDGSYARDRSGYNNHGTIYGAARADGKIGMALSFDGIDDYVEVADKPSLRPASVTMTARVKTTSTADMRVLAKTKPYLVYWNGYELGVVGGRARPGLGKGDEIIELLGTSYIADGKWHLIAGTYDDATNELKVIVDGVVENTGTFPYIGDHSGVPLWVGNRQGWNLWFDGIIDEVRIYNRALSADEIRMLMYRRLV